LNESVRTEDAAMQGQYWCQWLAQGIGGSKSLRSGGAPTASGVSSQNREIQFEKPTPGLFTSHPRSQGKAHQCDPDAPGLCTQIWKLKQKPTARVGVVKSLEFSIADRIPRANFRKIPKTFFACVQCGLGNRAGESATNFAGPSWRKKAVRGATGREATRVTLIELALTP
jgi:hypothetical protein